ncbi:DUF3099 domain-containing protein [Herbiconiux sp. L3-i23]|uniref:DUF3099 domain-containing protein n=1 Tax=Herbiconiux sp. L3-i23 TaxID=2905871 RepID=UPI00205738F1|nr:DUF3099 domain-containing protein [Herbiconiux sp. L3-i23]BDI22709.1 hypothetical protein L3i23_14850 [Herbiconiux sp. L3-i23]
MTKRNQPQSITNLPASAQDDRRARMIKYSIAMGIRTICVILLVFLHDWWWILLAAAGAIVLPYIAVVVANVTSKPKVSDVERPGAILPVVDPLRGRDPHQP